MRVAANRTLTAAALVLAVGAPQAMAGEFLAADVVGLTSATTLNGADISIDASSGVVLNGSSTVIATDVMAKNGVVHVIDAVLIAQTE